MDAGSRARDHGVRATRDPATDPERRDRVNVEPVERVANEPMTVASRGRLYTTEDQRRRLGLTGPEKGRGTDVTTVISDVDRVSESFVHVNTAAFTATIATGGVIRIPHPVRERLDVASGDDLRVSIHRGKHD